MNGRTYDTRLGRFMQADIVIQSPFDTQSYNRYSYLTNNPLNGTDPSGYFGLKDLAGVAVMAVGTYACGGNPSCGTGTWALIGGFAGGAQSAAYGGNFQQIVTGAVWGAFSSAAFAGFNGSETFGWGSTGQFGQHALNIAASPGVLGGSIAVTQGGKFGHGFASAGVSAAAVGGMNGAGIKGPARVIGAAIAGGTASVVSGGKFANGALTGAFQAAVGSVVSQADSSSPFSVDENGERYFVDSVGSRIYPDRYFDSEGNPLLADVTSIGTEGTVVVGFYGIKGGVGFGHDGSTGEFGFYSTLGGGLSGFNDALIGGAEAQAGFSVDFAPSMEYFSGTSVTTGHIIWTSWW